MTLVGTPCLNADAVATVAPVEIAVDRGFLLFVALIIGVVQGELLQGCEVTLDPIEPRSARRSPIEFDLM